METNPEYFDPIEDGSPVRQRYNLDGKIVIGYVGSLRPWHGLDLLVTAFAALAHRIQGMHLLLVGSGSMETALKDQIRQAGIENHVTLTGPIDHQHVKSYLGRP